MAPNAKSSMSAALSKPGDINENSSGVRRRNGSLDRNRIRLLDYWIRRRTDHCADTGGHRPGSA
jgi:hypothetical protein